MRSQGSARELERRRQLAAARVKEGYPQMEVAALLGGTPRHGEPLDGRLSPGRWLGGRLGQADAGSSAQADGSAGEPVLSWLAKPPTRFGFATNLWTSRRLATLIEQRLSVHFDANYLVA